MNKYSQILFEPSFKLVKYFWHGLYLLSEIKLIINQLFFFKIEYALN